MSESSEDEGAGVATAASVTLTSSSNISTSSSVMGANKQKSLFAGMGRVRHINHLREKWSGKPKAMPPIRVIDATSSATSAAAISSSSYASSTMMALRKVKKLHVSNKLLSGSGSESDRELSDFEKKRRRALSSMDMERYHTLSTWLERNGIEIPQHNTHRRQSKMTYGTKIAGLSSPAATHSATLHASAGKADLFDDVYNSLEMLERAVKTEISQLGSSTSPLEQQSSPADEPSSPTSTLQQSSTDVRVSPSLVDYLVVIGPDVTDITIQNYWHNEENVYEATVAFAWPPESQFNAESIEHFCFPSGVKVARHEDSDTLAAPANFEGDQFFVLVLSGGGAQGQSVQYASCVKGWIRLPCSSGNTEGLAVPVCYCLISEMPFIPFFKEMLMRLLDGHRRDFKLEENLSSLSSILSNRHAHKIDDVLCKLKEVALPAKGCEVPVHVFEHPDNPMNLCRPREEAGADEKNTLLLQWALPHLLANLSIERILRIVGFLLLEMKVIFVSKSLTLLSSATLGLASLLHPLKWAGPLITVLPPFLHEYLEAPVPLICGVDYLSSTFECTQGTVIIQLDKNEVCVHNDDIQMLAGHNLPGFDKLSQSLVTITKQRRSEQTGPTFQTTHFAAGVVMRRVRLHIEYLLGECSDMGMGECNEKLDETRHERELLRMLMRSQMYQRHQDDSQKVCVVTQCGEGSLLSSPVAPLHLPLDTKLHSERPYDWKTTAGVLFRIAMTGVNVIQDENDSLDSNNPADTDTRAEGEKSTGDQDEDRDGDWIRLLSAEVTLPGQTYSNQSLKSTSSRRTNHDLDRLHPSPSGSPIAEKERQSAFGNRVNDSSFVAAQHSHRQPSRKGDLGFSQSYSPISPLVDAQFDFLDPKSNRTTDNARVRSNSDLITYDNLGITIDPRRVDTEAAMADSDIFVGEEPTDSPESDSSWFSASSSVDGKDTDSYDQDSPRYREQLLELSAVTCEDGRFTRDAEIVSSTRASSSRTIQRAWRQWKAEQQSVGVEKGEPLGWHAVDLLWSSIDGQQDQKVLSTGALVHKRNKRGEQSAYRLSLAPGKSCISWESHESSKRYLLSSVALSDLTQVIFEASGFNESQRGGCSTIELQYDNKQICFQYELTSDHICFVSALHRLVYSVAAIREVGPGIADQVQLVKALTPSPTKACGTKASADINKDESDDSFGPRDLETFKLRLQEGFLVEKHGRVGKPHVRMLFTDVLSSRIMWKKPSQDNSSGGYERISAAAGKRRTSNSFFQKSLLVSNITAVVAGKQTQVFKRSVARQSEDERCISIVTTSRTLDFRALSGEDFEVLYRGLSSLVGKSDDLRSSSS